MGFCSVKKVGYVFVLCVWACSSRRLLEAFAKEPAKDLDAFFLAFNSARLFDPPIPHGSSGKVASQDRVRKNLVRMLTVDRTGLEPDDGLEEETNYNLKESGESDDKEKQHKDDFKSQSEESGSAASAEADFDAASDDDDDDPPYTMEHLQFLRDSKGPRHHETLQYTHELVQDLRARSDFEKAELLQRELIDVLSYAFGPKNMLVVGSWNNLAVILFERGELKAAEQVMLDTLSAHTSKLDQEHPAIIDCKNNLSMVSLKLGKAALAYETQKEVVSARSQVFGPNNRLTLRSKQNLATILRAQGDDDGAMELLRENSKHQDVQSDQELLSALISESNIVHSRGDLERAKELQEDIVKACEKIYGPNHLTSLQSKHNLACSLHKKAIEKYKEMDVEEAIRDLKKAERLNRVVFKCRNSIFGSEHPDTLESKESLASTIFYRGDRDRAVSMQKDAVETWSRKFGHDFPSTLESKYRLEKMLKDHDKEAADKLHKQILDSGGKYALVKALQSGGFSDDAMELSREIFDRSLKLSAEE